MCVLLKHASMRLELQKLFHDKGLNNSPRVTRNPLSFGNFTACVTRCILTLYKSPVSLVPCKLILAFVTSNVVHSSTMIKVVHIHQTLHKGFPMHKDVKVHVQSCLQIQNVSGEKNPISSF